ncbi:poly(ADP-ribose) glycohydrolase [Striga asiatica]|uniref:poly(ADP-ribose) glycohydrolase n=1 Tax=Striga asiatica TaxID=4170 RepID=A0A5A7P5V1_STRAF|nr:poly(ADP-ribose) glycohydrolase [Striga asiatica]
MDCREDFRSILPFLPVIIRSDAAHWPPPVEEALRYLSRGTSQSNVNSGQLFALAIADLRNSLGVSTLHPSASLGLSLFFDTLMSKDESETWFRDVIPRLADLLLKLPALLEAHYQNAAVTNGMETGLKLLEAQQPGIVILSQELIAALLACALFCLFPTTGRGEKHLRSINFDKLFLCLHERNRANQENKIKCIVHYFERVCKNMPAGNVSFERKVLPLRNSSPSNIVYPEADFWINSTISLCRLEVHIPGLIEDQPTEALEVDFANRYIGGGVLRRGCVQEEIRFVTNPELITSMLFLPMMADNEAIEIIGSERFSNYTGYSSSFRFSGDHEDEKGIDKLRRRKTRIIAIDALRRPGEAQYTPECLLREINKSFCGFFNSFEGEGEEIGVATGNWGCGAFGGDPQVKAVIQWLAASQAKRPFVLYYTFGLEQLEKLEMVVQWIVSQKWSVGEVWSKLVEYSGQRLSGKTAVGFFEWLI